MLAVLAQKLIELGANRSNRFPIQLWGLRERLGKKMGKSLKKKILQGEAHTSGPGVCIDTIG
jgi:hypothetical protein